MFTLPDTLDYVLIGDVKSPSIYTATLITASGQDANSRVGNTLSGTAALTAATVTATTALFASSNSNSFAADALITATTISPLAAFSSAPALSSMLPSENNNNNNNDNMFNNVAVDLGSLLINASFLNETDLLADFVNISDAFTNDTAAGNMTSSEDLGELIRMAATSVVLGLMILITIIGNVFVIAAIILERNLQNVANYLVASLAVADLFVACLVMPLGAVYEISQGWILGPELCDIWTSIDVLCCTASILHLVAIAVDRYWAVTNIDYIHSRTSRRVFLMIFFVWTAAVIVSLAPQFGWKDPDYLQRIEQQKCMVSQDIAYQIFATCCTFYVPLLVILFLYWKIYQTARKRIHRRRPKPINITGNNNQPDLTTQKKRKRLRLRIGKLKNDKTNVGTTLGLVEGNSTHTVNTVEVEDTEFSSSNVDNKSRAGVEVTNLNLNTTEEVPSSSTSNNQQQQQQITTVSHLVALAHETQQTLLKTTQQQSTQTTTKTTTCLTQPVQVQENPLEPLKTCSTTTPIITAATTVQLANQTTLPSLTPQPPPAAPTCNTSAITTNEIPAISATSDNGNVVINNNSNSNNNNNHHYHNHPTLEVLADPHLQQQLEQVQQQVQPCDNTTPAAHNDAMDCGTTAMTKTQGATTSNATTITSISALSPQTPTIATPLTTIPLSNYTPHTHTPNPPSAYASSQVTPVPRAKQNPQQPLSSIANPMHKVTKRKETLEAKRERKAAKTLAIITGAFVVCWLPFFAMALLLPLCESCEINDAVASFFLWLGYFNSTLNPVIYTIFSPEFRQAFKRILFGGHRPVHYRSGKL